MKELGKDFKLYHFAIIGLQERKDVKIKQAAFNDDEDRIGNLGDRLQQLILQDEPARKEPSDP